MHRQNPANPPNTGNNGNQNWRNRRRNHSPANGRNDNRQGPGPGQNYRGLPRRQQQNRGGGNDRRTYNRDGYSKLYFNFHRLDELSKKDSDEVVTTLAKKKTEFEDLLQNVNTQDLVVVTLRVLTNVCQANFTEIVTSVLANACSANFLLSLETYLKGLAFENPIEKVKNKLYHEDTNRFWSNLIEFFKKVIELLPTRARDELTPILQKINPISLSIEMSQGYNIDQKIKDDALNMFKELEEEIRKVEEKNKPREIVKNESQIEEEPPENFRSLGVIPTMEDLYDRKPFIRANKIKDAYSSVEHYLDVQFRLLREDFVYPLRSGIQEFLHGPQKYRNEELRIYKKVMLIAPKVAKNNVGIMVYFGSMKNINWSRSKRFMFGGLLMLSSDNFNTVLFVTVADRDDKELQKGYILIEPCEGTDITRDMYNTEFVMLESKIYFEPYLAVLNAMQHMNEKNFPMENYLVRADTSTVLPKYLGYGSFLQYKGYRLPIGGNGYWPSAGELKLDQTQYNAFASALTQEFAVIQGPPGTGKTFIALEIVSTLLENKEHWARYGPIVIVCLTNHALDQFLEGILKYTTSIVRVGSRSKSETLKAYMLMERRKLGQFNRKTDANSVMYETKHELESILGTMEKARVFVKHLTTPDAIVPLSCLTEYCEDVELRGIKSNEELVNWLIGTKLTPLPDNANTAQLGNLPGMMPEDNQEDDEDRHMDDELELNYQFQVEDSFKSIFPLKSMDALIENIRHQIHEYRNSDPEMRDLAVDPTIDLLKDQNTLGEQRRYLQHQLAQHPVLNKPRYQSNNRRWRSYWKWVKLSYDNAMNKITGLETTYRQVRSKLNEAKQLVDLAVLREHKIIGLTTTGAAKLHASLRALRAPIVLVEEAAEILEAHVVCSLSKDCQHVILIGDHKQLRPKASVYQLGTKYNLNISLFERMVNIRGNCTQLAHQHRMRPQIARLITPSIYETLYNHESVFTYPDVKGLEKNLFFLHHNNHESSHNNEESWVNQHEAAFLVAFAKHLIMQGYDGSEITILCTYTGQLFALMKETARYAVLRQLRVTTIDNYQGEENRIILLSLVRNNGEGNIGFLKEENRVCVALSRAREGLYIMGNMDDLVVKNKIWPKIKQVLEEERAIGDSLQVRCQIHPDQTMLIKNVTDFLQCPEGGCQKKCNADLNCGHSCTSICHILDREHKEIQCRQPCIKTCPYDHPCPLKCWDGCRPCLVTVERKLRCGHTVKMPCSTNPQTFRCYIEVEAILPDCHHIVKKPCHRPVRECKCPHPCENRPPCGHTCRSTCHVNEDPDHIQYKCFKDCMKNNIGCVKDHPCKKRCHEECGPCAVLIEKTRSCGHHYKQFQCSVDVETEVCKRDCRRTMNCGHDCKLKCWEACGNCQVQVEAILPDCNHKVKKPCHRPVEKTKCSHPCKNRVPCGHTCRLNCHVNEDPDHIQYKCLKDCTKNNVGCVREHPCKKRCHEECGPCAVLVEKTRSCGHKFKRIQCTVDVETEVCKGDCRRKMNCGHDCKLQCWEACGNCQVQVKKRSPCGHVLEVKCCEDATISVCNGECQKKLACGHPCTARCKDPCTKICKTMVRQSYPGLCGHIFSVPCHLLFTGTSPEELSKYCEEPCGAQLDCEHICGGKCGSCKQGRIHVPCVEPCGNILVCGHKCDIPCRKECQPCNKLCELQCRHSNCSEKCGVPCTPCNELCEWGCDHRKCTKRCSELCDIQPCTEPCKKLLICNHPCVGFCGDPCPPLCRICDEEELTEVFFGDEDEPDARFVLLEDCGHCIESEALLTWITKSSESIQMKACPRCKTPIRKCMRLMNQMKKDLEDVIGVKRKLFGQQTELQNQQTQHLQTMRTMFSSPNVAEFPELENLLRKLWDQGILVRNQRRQILSLQEVEALRVLLDILQQIYATLALIKKRTVNFYRFVKKQVSMLVESLPIRGQISDQELIDINLELQRLNYMAEMCKIDAENINDGIVRVNKRDYDAVAMKLVSIERFTEKMKLEVRNGIFAIQKSKTNVISERQMIVRAMGFSQGHWFKCPNGHIYSIGECGGAMQRSKCNECGAVIGGDSHRLQGDNALATEMDGATHSAWPGRLY